MQMEFSSICLPPRVHVQLLLWPATHSALPHRIPGTPSSALLCLPRRADLSGQPPPHFLVLSVLSGFGQQEALAGDPKVRQRGQARYSLAERCWFPASIPAPECFTVYYDGFLLARPAPKLSLHYLAPNTHIESAIYFPGL